MTNQSVITGSMIALALALAAALAAPASAAPRPISLDEAYAAALRRSETVAEAGATYEQTIAQVDYLWSAVKPHLNLVGSQEWQDTPGPGVNFPLPANQHTAAISGHQPLFSGLRDFLAIREAHDQGEAAALQLERAKQLLYQDVTSAYLNLLTSHQDIAAREAQVALTRDRVKELRNFEDIGRSRRSEVLAAQARVAQDEADVETARAQERLYQATLRFLTGLDEELDPQAVPAPAAVELAPFLDRAVSRPDVLAAEKNLDASRLFVSIQRRQYWPTVSLDGNYYLLKPNNFSKNIRWDATVSGQLPLYWGGQIGAQTRQARAQQRYNEAALSLARRQAELDVRAAHNDLASGLSIVKALENAKALAEENAKAQAVDYRHGLVTNLDVLSSLTVVQDTTLRLDAARAAAYLARVRLEVAAGGPGSAR